MNKSHRGTIRADNAEVLKHTVHAADQYILRLHSPECAKRARPGSFVHVQCDADIPMRRPLSIMRADAIEGWIELLYRPIGRGLEALARIRTGQHIDILGPIGNGFSPHPDRPLAALIGGGVGIPPLLFLAERLRDEEAIRPLAFFGSEVPIPLELRPSKFKLGMGPDVPATGVALLEDWGVPSRLASAAGMQGYYRGFVTDLAREWMIRLDKESLRQVTIYACGPGPMLRATAGLAREFGLPSQLCMEEYMACGVGGCAGCAVLVKTERGPAMRRVCVDGPVFAGDSVYPAA